MKLNPQQAPLYGECVLTVQLNDEECVEDEEVEFYLLFAGTTQRHLTTTLRVSHVTLQAVCPAHNCGETVQVTLCQARPGGLVDTVGEDRFQFVQDLALDMAQFLLSASGQRDGLEGALLLDECQIPLQECERLDETLALALRHIPLPPGWSVLGTDINTHSNTADPGPHETLLHFAARRGLRRVALFLLQQPGGQDALRHPNKQGHTPAGVAHKRGHSQLQHLLSELEESPRFETKAARPRFPGGRGFLHHPKLNTFTLTVDSDTDTSPPDLRTDVEELQRFIKSHPQEKGLSLIEEQQPVSLILSNDIFDGSQKAARTSCPGPSLQNLPVCEHQEAEAVAERENGELLNGTGDYTQLEQLEKVVELESSAGEGVCVEGRVQSGDISGTSRGELQQEEADREVCVITAEQKEHFSNTTHNKPQSGNSEEAAMGQSQGLLPSETKHGSEKSEESRRRDLPKEKEGEASSGQETADLSTLQQGVLEEGGQKHSEKQADGCCVETQASSEHLGANQGLINQGPLNVNAENSFDGVLKDDNQNSSKVRTEGSPEENPIHFSPGFVEHSEVIASKTGNEIVGCSENRNDSAGSPEEDTGNHCATIEADKGKGFNVLETDSALDSISLRPNMAPGPVHKVRRESSPLPDCRKPEETVVEVTENPGDPAEQDQQINQMTVSPAATASASVRELPDEAGSSDDVADGVNDEADGFMESVAAVSSPAEEDNGEVASIQVTPGGAPSLGVSEDGAGEKRDDIRSSLVVAGAQEKSSQMSEDASSSDQATVGKTQTHRKEDAPSSDVAALEEKSPDAEVEEASQRSEDPSPSELTAVEETLSGEGEAVSSSVEAAIGETLPEAANGEPSQRHEAPCDETANEEAFSSGSENVSPAASSSEGDTSSQQSKDAFDSAEATVGETLLGESGDSSLSDLTALMEKLSVVSKDASPSDETGCGETSPQRCEDGSPSSLTAEIEETSADTGVGETLFQKSEAESPSEESGVTGAVTESVETPPSDLTTAEKALSEENTEFNESQPETGVITDTPELTQGLEGSQSPQNEALSVDQTHEVPTPASKPEEVPCNPFEASEATCVVSGNSKKTILHNQPEESNKEMDPAACEIPLPSTLTSTSTCDSMPKENSAEIITLDQQSEVVTSGAESHVSQALEQTVKAIHPSSDTHTKSEGSNETREECVSSNIASHEGDSPSTSPCDSCVSKEGNIQGISLDPQSETSRTEGLVPDAPLPVSIATDIEYTSADSICGCSLDNTSTSDTLGASTLPLEKTLPLDKDNGTALGLDTGSPVEVDSGLSHDLPPSDTDSSPGGLCGSNSLNEERNQTEGECRGKEEPHEEQVADNHNGSAEDGQTSLTDMDQAAIHRETEVFYPLESCSDDQEQKEPPSAENSSTGCSVEAVCRSVSASSVVESESISDGDSLLSVETTDDSVFKQSEDAVTRTADSTSGVSVTGSSSTDDSSSLEPCGSEPQSEEGNEGTLTPCSDQPIGGVLTLSSDQPVEDTLTPVSDHPAEGALTPVSDHPAEGALTPVSDHPAEGALTPVSDHPAEGALTPVSDHPDEGALTPVCDQPVGDALIPGSEQPAEGAPQTAGETEEEERKDRLSEVPERSAILRSSVRSLSPSRRHSWGPSKNSAGEAETQVQRSVVQSADGGKPAGHRRSMSWCPSDVPRPETDEMNARSYSLEGLAEGDVGKCSALRQAEPQHDSSRPGRLDSEERGSLVSLTEEEQESDMGDASSLDSQQSVQGGRRCAPPPPLALTKSVSMSAISPRDLDVIGRTRPKRRISFSFSVSPILAKSKTLFAIGSSSSEDEEAANLNSFTRTAESLENSISEEDPGPLRSDSSEARVGGTKVSRTFSYLKSKMSKKSKEKDREKNKDGKEKEKRSSSGHLFSSVSTVPPSPCLQCSKTINTKDALQCANCSAHIHKGCREGLPVCAKVKMKQQQTVPDSASGPGVPLRSKSVTVRERPWSTVMAPDDQMPPPPIPPPRKSPGIMAFNTSPLSKSISISNIAGQTDDAPLKGLKFLSQSTDSLHKVSKVNESTESLTDEGAELMEGQLMWDFESDAKELEADSWSSTMDKKYLKQLKKDVVKRQDVIYELIQTEMHHVRTLHIMADVYSKGLQKEMQLETQTLEKMFPVMEELLDVHTDFFTHLLERKRAEQAEKDVQGGYIIRRIGDVLLEQVTGFNADRMTKVYGKFCSRHNEAVNLYKELHAKDKRFQAFIKKTMSSSIVRRLSIPECILLVTQRITKYPVLLQRILQHTKEPEEEQGDTAEALQQVKEVIAAVDLKVSEYEMRQRLKEIHSRTDSKSIMRMKSGQMFAKEDLIRGRRLVHDGPLQLKNTAGRLKDVQALLLSDVFVFLQEKDQKYVFASLDQRSTVISLRKLIVREVANEERGLFLITAGMEKPEMVEVYSSSKVERNTWIQLIQNTMQSIEKEDDEGIPSENEEDKRLQEVKAKEMRDQLQKKDDQIVGLLEDKVRLFRELCECSPAEDATLRSRMMFRATPDEVTKGEPIISHALKEVEKLQELVNGSVCGAVGQQVCAGQESVCVSSVSLPRRAETFGGFDSHQMNSSKTKDGEKEEADESVDLRRTESDSVLKKGGNANLLLLLKRNSEQVLQSVTRLHDLLNTLQAVVVQQDTFIEDQRQALNDRSSRHPSVSSSSSSSSSSRPASLIEQEKQRSAERLRQEAEERRRRQKEWEQKEKEVQQREERLNALEEENTKRRRELDEEKNELQNKKEEYQRDLARLRDSQRRLEREREQLYTQSQLRQNVEDHLQPRQRTSSTASEDSLKLQSATEPAEGVELSSSPSTHDLLSRLDSKRKSKNLNLFSSGSGQKGGATAEPQSQMPSRLLQLAKPKEKKEKKKKKGKGQQNQPTDAQGAAEPGSSAVFFC
ncbi:A-kinase anchor protein 13 isoform X4 [Astyanax mexicanus]|uniref:A-kinase anchor protein 13 isoform X4 n=1 Tax=Astyanax mexicanus TaxID=7994 RepID=UPI0020CA9CBC|nr:A-kinase anchor protein 13 isoform X4 [Astyanax mexicanus]